MWELLIIWFNVGIWYSSSVVSGLLSKHLLSEGLSSDVLTLCQLAIGCTIVRVTLFFRGTKVTLMTKQVQRYMITIAFTFAVGFKTLNAGLAIMAVASCMTLRVTEPLFTWVILKVLAVFSSWTHPSNYLLLPIFFVVVGAMLAVWNSADVKPSGLFAILISNTCFSSRSIILKQVQQEQNMDPFLIFYHICKFAMIIEFVWLIVLSYLSGPPSMPRLNLLYLLSSGVIWYVYLQFSTIVNFWVNAITHTTLNAVRQTMIIIVSALYMGIKLSWLNMMGIVLTLFGGMLWSYFRRFNKPLYLDKDIRSSKVNKKVELGSINFDEEKSLIRDSVLCESPNLKEFIF